MVLVQLENKDNILKIKRISENAKIPVRQNKINLYACINNQDKKIEIKPGELVFVPCGIAIELESPEYVALLFVENKIINYSVNFPGSVGVIDSDYRGELNVVLRNNSKNLYTINHGDKIAYLIIMKIVV